MCGICGKLALADPDRPIERETISKMTQTLQHRGPDDQGLFLSRGVGLGHRRLKIIDLSSGKQPIANEDETVWVVYNGEIYNYQELRSFLVARGHRFRTRTDTEVIVHLYEECGEGVVAKLQGMFSLALWDEKQRRLLLARDRVGIKPLYYYLSSDFLIFASELKAILADASVRAEIEEETLDRFLTHLYLPGEQTLLRRLFKLKPGHYLMARDGRIQTKQYWDLRFSSTRHRQDIEESAHELDELLARTVRAHMISDVPVGVLLSGGVDSTAMLSYAVETTGRKVQTFTIGFDDPRCTDERPFARLAAARYGTEHYDITISAKDFLAFLPNYVWHMEEPVCEPPGVALYYVSKLARDHVTVLLSGEGGDEAFAGYPNYRNLVWLERLKTLLGPLRTPASSIAAGLSQLIRSDRLARYGKLMTLPLEGYYLSRTATPLNFFNRNKTELYTREFQDRVQLNGFSTAATEFFTAVRGRPTLDQMLYVDSKTWLPDDLLVKADKMTMANSVELRVPLLDHHVLEFAASLRPECKLRGFSLKYLLKKTLLRKVPCEILQRKKAGFPVPYVSWLQQDAKKLFWELLTDRRTTQRGYFRQEQIEHLLHESTNHAGYAKEIFSLAVLELWHRIFLEGESPSLLAIR